MTQRWLLLALLAFGSPAEAKELRSLPTGVTPQSLGMRASAFRVAAAEGDDEADDEKDEKEERGSGLLGDLLGRRSNFDVDSGELDRLQSHRLEADVLPPVAPLSDQVVFRFNVGMNLASGALIEGGDLLSGLSAEDRDNYEALRSYAFGDVVMGSRGLGFDGLNSYVAAFFRFDQDLAGQVTAFPTVYDRNLNIPLVRSAYAEVEELFDGPLLRNLHLRAGRIFDYGVAPVQYDGLTFGYDSPVLKLDLFVGARSSIYGLPAETLANSGAVAGANLRADLFEWRRWPLVLFASTVDLDDHSFGRLGVAMRWNRDVLLRSDLRYVDGERSRFGFSARTRLSDVTTLNVQMDNRNEKATRFGLLQVETPDSAADPRRYLDLGPPQPRSLLSMRYGTVLFRNLDVLLRAGGALDRRDEDDAPNPFNRSYLEGGGALEVQVRRALRLGTAVSGRRYFLDEQLEEAVLVGQPDDLPTDLRSTGITSFLEGGLNLNYSAGARQFNASAEFYGRYYRYASNYREERENDLRSGGRFSLEGWALERVRLRAEYELTFHQVNFAPELRSLKTLRILMEGHI